MSTVHPKRGWRAALAALSASLLIALAMAPAAGAAKYVDRLLAGGPAAGTAQGQLNTPRGIAINDPGVADATTDPQGDSTDGYLYVVEELNHRVQVFGPNGDFKFMFGRGVQSGGDGAEVCDHTEVPCTATVADDEEGEFNRPAEIAINQQTGDLYITERVNRRVQQFTAAGAFVRAWGWGVDTGASQFEVCASTCQAGIVGVNGGQFAAFSINSPFTTLGIAVDPSAPHHVIVGDPGNLRLQQFTAAGAFVRAWGWDVVPPGQPGDSAGDGSAHNPTSSFEICESTALGACRAGVPKETSFVPARKGLFGYEAFNGSSLNPRGRVAIDAAGVIYADSRVQDSLQRFNIGASTPDDLALPFLKRNSPNDATVPEGEGFAIGAPFEFDGELEALAIHPQTDDLLTAWSRVASVPPTPLRTLQLDTSLEPPLIAEHHLVATELNVHGLAVDPSSDDFYLASTSGGHRLFAADDDGAPPALVTLEEPLLDGFDVSLTGTVTPGGPPGFNVTYNFQLSKDGGATWTDVPATDNPLGDGLSPVPVSDEAKDLDPNTHYKARILTRKAFGNPDVPSPNTVEFTTEAVPPVAETVAPAARSATSAVLSALIDPRNSETSYFFEWGTDQTYGNLAPLPPASAGSGVGPRLATTRLEGLAPATTYHYRVVADNGVEVSPGLTQVFGANVSFTTRSSPSAPTPDRAYELVSPADKYGGQGLGFWPWGLGHLASAGTAAHTGERFIATGLYGSVLSGEAGFGLNTEAVFAERVSGQQGWKSAPVLTHPDYDPTIGKTIEASTAAEDFSSISWISPSPVRMFPEMTGANPEPGQPHWGNLSNLPWLSEWKGLAGGPTRWELLGPRGLSSAEIAPAGFGSTSVWTTAISPDGSTAYGLTGRTDSGGPIVYGLAGPDDPTAPANGDLITGRSIYAADLSKGLSDSFAGVGERPLVNVCTGAAGPARTTVPAVILAAGGALGSAGCPAGIGGRERLISPRGATANFDPTGVVSENGSRLFFLSPDPSAPGVPTAGCSGAGATALCPPQLFLRQRNPDGSVVVRWISKAAPGLLGAQNASLASGVRFEGASRDGSVVYFRTAAPLTADDPNGDVAVPGGVKTGAPNPASWDLYRFDLAPGPDPTGPGSSLTRVSAGPSGEGDCNSPLGGEGGALRFLSDDGERAYFTCAAPLPGVPAPANGTITAPGGTAASANQANLYLYDAAGASAQWRFIARLPRSTSSDFNACASTGVRRRSGFGGGNGYNPRIVFSNPSNCVRGSADGAFITLFTAGRLSADDPPTPPGGNAVADIYAYDAELEELTRITAPQGGPGGPYFCAPSTGTGSGENLTRVCHGDGGVDSHVGSGGLAHLGVAVEPLIPGDRIAFFQSASRLVPEDTDDNYDVYQWRNGELTLLSSGAPDSKHALYKGNDRSGRNVYFATMQALTWQDFDAVNDVYTARVGGGIPEPPAPPLCDVLADACQGAAPAAPAASGAASSVFAGQGNFTPPQATTKPCNRNQVRRANRCLAKRVLANRACAKRKGAAKRRCVAGQMRRLNRTANADRRAGR